MLLPFLFTTSPNYSKGYASLYHEDLLEQVFTWESFGIISNDRDSIYLQQNWKDVLVDMYSEIKSYNPPIGDPLSQMQAAQEWMDANTQINHGWNPYTLSGGLGVGAAIIIGDYFKTAINCYRNYLQSSDEANKTYYINRAYWNLGCCMHLIEDLTVPHHAALIPPFLHIFYHGEYETFVGEFFKDTKMKETDSAIVVDGFDIINYYETQRCWLNKVKPAAWVQTAALESYEYIQGFYNNPPPPSGSAYNNYPIEWRNAAEELQPLALRLTAGFVFYFYVVANNIDMDNDGISSYNEYLIYETDPLSADTDADGIDDFEETVVGEDGFITDPNDEDSDGDGISDYDEIYFTGSNPLIENDNVAIDNFDDFNILDDSNRIDSFVNKYGIHLTYEPTSHDNTYSTESYTFNFPPYENFRIDIKVDWTVNSKTPIWHSLLEAGNMLYDLYGGYSFTRIASVGTRDSWASYSGQFRSYGNGEWRYSDTYGDMALSDNNVKYSIQKIGSILTCKISRVLKSETIYFEETYEWVSGSVNSVLLWYKHSDNYFDGESQFNINSIRGVFWE